MLASYAPERASSGGGGIYPWTLLCNVAEPDPLDPEPDWVDEDWESDRAAGTGKGVADRRVEIGGCAEGGWEVLSHWEAETHVTSLPLRS